MTVSQLVTFTRKDSHKADRKDRTDQRLGLIALEQRIKETESQKLELERTLAETFSNGKPRDVRRIQRQLDRAASLLQDLYDQWFNKGG